MKKIILLTFVFLSIKIQAQQIDSINFCNAVDYVNSQLTITYLKTLKDDKDKSNFENLKIDLKQNSFDKPIRFEILETKLKKDFKTTFEELTSKIETRKIKFKANLTPEESATLITDNNELSENFNKILKDETKILKDTLSSSFEKIIKKEKPKDTFTENTSKENSVMNEVEESKNTTNSFWSYNINFGTILLIIVISIFISIIFNNLTKFNINNKFDKIEDRIEKRKNELELINKEVVQIQNQIKDLKNQTSTPRNSPQNNTEKIIETEKPKIEIVKTEFEEFYFPFVNKDGSFNDSQKSKNRNPNSLYKLKIKNNAEEGSFEYIGNEISLLRDTLSAPYEYLEPVCEIENPDLKRNSINQIATIKTGILKKKFDKWVLINKTKIRYE